MRESLSLFAELSAKSENNPNLVPDFSLGFLQKRFNDRDLEELYLRYEQRAQIGESKERSWTVWVLLITWQVLSMCTWGSKCSCALSISEHRPSFAHRQRYANVCEVCPSDSQVIFCGRHAVLWKCPPTSPTLWRSRWSWLCASPFSSLSKTRRFSRESLGFSTSSPSSSLS